MINENLGERYVGHDGEARISPARAARALAHIHGLPVPRALHVLRFNPYGKAGPHHTPAARRAGNLRHCRSLVSGYANAVPVPASSALISCDGRLPCYCRKRGYPHPHAR